MSMKKIRHAHRYARALVALGFRKDGESQSGGCPMRIYRRDVGGGRVIDVQLWADNKHRASHSLNGRWSTLPTDFTTIAGMREAIEREKTRMDHPKRGHL